MSNTILMNDGMRHPANPSSREKKNPLAILLYSMDG